MANPNEQYNDQTHDFFGDEFCDFIGGKLGIFIFSIVKSMFSEK
jgi:hypothetical protein